MKFGCIASSKLFMDYAFVGGLGKAPGQTGPGFSKLGTSVLARKEFRATTQTLREHLLRKSQK